MTIQLTRAWEFPSYSLETLRQSRRPLPALGERDVLVRVHAVSLNYRDWQVIEGQFFRNLPLPFVPASDAAGVVVETGSAVTRVRKDDRVVTQFFPEWIEGADPRHRSVPLEAPASLGGPLPGVLSEYIVANEQALVRPPEYLSLEQASTLPIAGLTAWSALFEQGKTHAGQYVLIEGTGGVALFALQLAHAAGARTIVLSSSDEKLVRARELGADFGLNYSKTPAWSAAVQDITNGWGVDRVVDTAGGATLAQALQALAIDGQIAVIGYTDAGTTTLPLLPFILKRARMTGVTVGSRTAFESLNRFMEKHTIAPVIDHTYAFDAVPQAFAHLKRGAFGKIVIRVGE